MLSRMNSAGKRPDTMLSAATSPDRKTFPRSSAIFRATSQYWSTALHPLGTLRGQHPGSGNRQNTPRLLQLLALEKGSCGGNPRSSTALCPTDARERARSGSRNPPARTRTSAHGKDFEDSSPCPSGQSARPFKRLHHARDELLHHRSNPVRRLRTEPDIKNFPFFSESPLDKFALSVYN